jgi:predicted DCC family thiol-disulfide oxidoreductase YuxK
VEYPVILFDGVCNLCSGAVRFIVERDPEGIFRFASLQSQAGRQLLRDYGVEPHAGDPDTVILIDHGRALDRSTAALHIALRLGGRYKLVFWLGRFVPRFVRDIVYDFVARHRYRWFGKTDACMVPTPELRARFL